MLCSCSNFTATASKVLGEVEFEGFRENSRVLGGLGGRVNGGGGDEEEERER